MQKKSQCRHLACFTDALYFRPVIIPTTASAPLPQAVIATPTPQADGRIIYICQGK